MTQADRAIPVPDRPFVDRAAVAVVGESLADVAREALNLARAESQSRPVLLVDLLGQGSALDLMFGDDDPHGVSDAARYGISLNRVAREVPNAEGLFVVPGGTESPLADDVLSDHLWGSWSDQCRRAGALLMVAAPADLPAVSKAIDQLDGLVVVGDAVAPATQAPVLGRVRSNKLVAGSASAPAVAPVPAVPAKPVDAVVEADADSRTSTRVWSGVIVLLTAIGVFGALWWNGLIGNRTTSAAREGSVGQPIVMPGEPTIDIPAAGAAGLPVDAAPWSVELASVSTVYGAMTRVRQALDSVPVLTFAATQPGGGAIWYRLRAGAFATSKEADSLLQLLRARSALEPAAGRVVQAPFAWLLEENVLEDQVPVRLFLWRQQGLPAYGLLDRNGTTRIYFGAFENEAEARLLTPMLDSLNLYATLGTRIGSVR